jgi:hypothetical protein
MNVLLNLHTYSQRIQRLNLTCALTINNVDEVFTYNADHQVLICIEHGYVPQNLHDHLRDEHSTTSSQQRAIIQKYTAMKCMPPAQVQPPTPFGPPIFGLRAPANGLMCEVDDCEFISINESVIRRHCNQVHKWRSSREDRTSWCSVQVQTFFSSGPFRRYFTVRSGVSVDAAAEATGARDEEEIQAIKNKWAETLQRHEREMKRVDKEIMKQD